MKGTFIATDKPFLSGEKEIVTSGLNQSPQSTSLEAQYVPEILTTEQLAERLQMTTDKVRELVRSGQIPAIRFNQRLWRFHWPTVLRALGRI